MKLKKIISSVLCGAMLASTALIGVTSVTAADELPFDDVPAKWFKNAVVTVYEEGIMQGKSDTKFDPTANITRAEVVTAFARIACTNIDGKGDALTFTDTKTGKWYSDSVGWAADNGIVKGRGDGRFSPSDNITRAELASIIINFVNYMELKLPDNPKIDKFSDASTFANWMKEPVEAVRKTGLMQGVDGKFNPKGNATRAEIAQVIANLLPSVGRVNVVENGKSDYVIVTDIENEGAYDAARRLQYQFKYVTGATLDIVDDSAKVSAKEIVIGDARESGIDKSELTGDGYAIAVDGGKVFVGSADADGLYRGAVKLALTCTSGDDVRFTVKSAERVPFEYPIGKLTINGNDISKYTILYPAGASANTMIGVNDLVEYIEKACGVKLEAKEGTSGDFAIIVKEAVVAIDGTPSGGVDNFSVKSEGNNIILTGAAERGAMYACYDFIEDVLGWVFLTETQDYLSPVDELDIKDLDYSEGSVFESREDYWGTYIFNEDMRNKHKMWNTPWTGGHHHTFQTLTDGKYDQTTQPCLSDQAIRDQMLGNVRKLLAENPDAQLISVSQNDNYNKCECDKCLASYEKYGSPAGINLELVNYIAEDIEDDYPNVRIHTFAYIYSLPAPVGIKPHKNIIVQVCSLEQCFRHPLNESCGLDNKEKFSDHLEAWADLGANMYIWDYTTNFSYSPMGMPNLEYEVLAGNMRLFAENNAMGIFAQGMHSGATERGEFDRLRAYLLAKLIWDPYMSEEDYNAHIAKYMEGFYGEEWEMVLEAMNLWLETDSRCHGIFDDIAGKIMYFYKDSVTTTLVDMLAEAELYTVSKDQFENTDRTQLMFDMFDVSARFDRLYKSANEEDVELSQKLCRTVRDKMLFYNISFGNMNTLYPNMEKFTVNPMLWKNVEEPEVVYSYSEVTVDIPDDCFDID